MLYASNFQVSVVQEHTLPLTAAKERVQRLLQGQQQKHEQQHEQQQQDDADSDEEVQCLEVGRRLKLICPVTFTRYAINSRPPGWKILSRRLLYGCIFALLQKSLVLVIVFCPRE